MKIDAREVYERDTRRLVVWQWVEQQPDRYNAETGFASLEQFLDMSDRRLREFIIYGDNEPIGMMQLYLRENGVCEVGVVTPKKTKVFPLLKALKVMQQSYLESFGETLLVDTPHGDAQRMARILGWRRVSDTIWEKRK